MSTWRVPALRRSVAGLAILLTSAPWARAPSEPDAEWTVLTVALDGAWGVSTARSQGEAIAGAVRQCQMRTADLNDCGAELVARRIGWALAMLCGDHRVLVTGDDRDAAETAARERVAALKQSYAPDLSPCRRILTVDPAGVVTKARELDG